MELRIVVCSARHTCLLFTVLWHFLRLQWTSSHLGCSDNACHRSKVALLFISVSLSFFSYSSSKVQSSIGFSLTHKATLQFCAASCLPAPYVWGLASTLTATASRMFCSPVTHSSPLVLSPSFDSLGARCCCPLEVGLFFCAHFFEHLVLEIEPQQIAFTGTFEAQSSGVENPFPGDHIKGAVEKYAAKNLIQCFAECGSK